VNEAEAAAHQGGAAVIRARAGVVDRRGDDGAARHFAGGVDADAAVAGFEGPQGTGVGVLVGRFHQAEEAALDLRVGAPTGEAAAGDGRFHERFHGRGLVLLRGRDGVALGDVEGGHGGGDDDQAHGDTEGDLYQGEPARLPALPADMLAPRSRPRVTCIQFVGFIHLPTLSSQFHRKITEVLCFGPARHTRPGRNQGPGRVCSADRLPLSGKMAYKLFFREPTEQPHLRRWITD